MESPFHSLNVLDGEAADEETIIDDFDIKDYVDPSMLGFISLILCYIKHMFYIFLIICYMRNFDHYLQLI